MASRQWWFIVAMFVATAATSISNLDAADFGLEDDFDEDLDKLEEYTSNNNLTQLTGRRGKICKWHFCLSCADSAIPTFI